MEARAGGALPPRARRAGPAHRGRGRGAPGQRRRPTAGDTLAEVLELPEPERRRGAHRRRRRRRNRGVAAAGRCRRRRQAPEMSVRSAITLALDEALASDDRVVLLGEDISDNGVFGVTKGLAAKYGAGPGARHAHLGAGHRGRRRGRRAGRPPAGGRDHVHGLPRPLPRPAGQPRRQAALHVGGPHPRPHGPAHGGGRRPAGGRPALADARGVAHPRPGPQGGRAEHAVRRPGPAGVVHRRRGPVRVHRAGRPAVAQGARRRRRPSRSGWPTSSDPAPTSRW